MYKYLPGKIIPKISNIPNISKITDLTKIQKMTDNTHTVLNTPKMFSLKLELSFRILDEEIKACFLRNILASPESSKMLEERTIKINDIYECFLKLYDSLLNSSISTDKEKGFVIKAILQKFYSKSPFQFEDFKDENTFLYSCKKSLLDCEGEKDSSLIEKMDFVQIINEEGYFAYLFGSGIHTKEIFSSFFSDFKKND